MGNLNITITQSFGSQIISKKERSVEIVTFNRGSRKMLESIESETRTLDDTLTLTNGSKTIQVLDPNGANRNVILPDEDNENHGYLIINTETSDYRLIVKDYAGTTIATVYAGGAGWFISNQAEWLSAGLGTIGWRIKDNGTDMTMRKYLDFLGFTITDDAANDKTKISNGFEVLTSSRNYYVRTDGDDDNDGLSNTSNGAFATIQHAIDVAANTLRTVDYNMIINVADGTYSEGQINLKPILGNGYVSIIGNTTTPSSVIVDGGFSSQYNPTFYYIQGIKLQTTGALAYALTSRFATIKFGKLVFDTGFTNQISALENGLIQSIDDYSITGAATRHIYATKYGIVNLTGTTTLQMWGTLAFTNFVDVREISYLNASGATITGGTITGKRYYATMNSVINTNGGGANFFPGDVAGSTASGAQYI